MADDSTSTVSRRTALKALGTLGAVENARLDAESERKSIAALRERKNDLDAELGSDSGSAADADSNIGTDADDGDEGGATTAPAAAIDDIETALAERRDRAQQPKRRSTNSRRSSGSTRTC